MVRKTVALVCALFLIFVVSCPVCFAAGALSEVNIGHAHIYTDLLHTYIDLTDADGNRAAQPDVGYVRGVMDDDLLQISVIKKFTDTGEGTAYIFLVDTSGSLSGSQFEKFKAATKNWAAKMGESDRMAVISFGNEVKTLLDFSSDKAQINNVVDGLSNNDGRTRLYDAVAEGLSASEKRGADIPKRKVIILLSDGENDASGGASRDSVIDLTKKHMIPIYSLCTSGKNSGNGARFMDELCELSHGLFFDISKTSVEDVYNYSYERLMNAYVIDFKYPSSKTDGAMHSLKISVMENGTEFSDTRELYMEKPTESAVSAVTNNAAPAAGEEENSDMNGVSKTTILLIIIIGVVVLAALVGIVALVVIMNGKKNARNVPPPQYRPIAPPPQSQAGEETVALGAQPQMGAARENNGPVFKMTDINSGEVFSAAVADSIIVGRKSDCDIVLRDGQVSGHHMKITRAGSGFRASDLGSTNGTIINGTQISGETEINRGDLILLGTKEYRAE